MQVYIDLENLLKEKNISKNKVCEACKLQRTQLNNYCKNVTIQYPVKYILIFRQNRENKISVSSSF